MDNYISQPEVASRLPYIAGIVDRHLPHLPTVIYPYHNPTANSVSIQPEAGRYPPMQLDLRSTMGNGVSGDQGNLPSHGKRDVGTSVVTKQHDWQTEQAVAPKPEIHSLHDTRKPYTFPETRVIGLHFCRCMYGSIFIQICAVGSKRRIFSAPAFVLAVQGRSGSSKVDDFGTNRKRVYDFLLAGHCDYGPILHRF